MVQRHFAALMVDCPCVLDGGVKEGPWLFEDDVKGPRLMDPILQGLHLGQYLRDSVLLIGGPHFDNEFASPLPTQTGEAGNPGKQQQTSHLWTYTTYPQ